MLRIKSIIRNPLQSPVNMVATLQKRTLAVTIHLRLKRSPINPPIGTSTA